MFLFKVLFAARFKKLWMSIMFQFKLSFARFFSVSSLLLLLSACAGNEPHPPFSFQDQLIYSDSSAPFIIEKVEGAGEKAISFIKKKGLIDTFILSLSACLKDRRMKDASIQETKFFVEYETNIPGAGLQRVEAPSDVNGCIQWEEEYKYKYVIQPVWIALSRVIKRKEGAYAGQSKIHLAVNPWLSSEEDLPAILDLRPQYSKEHKIFKKYPYEENGLAYLSQTDDFSEFPQLWAPRLDLQFDIIRKKAPPRQTGGSIQDLLARYKNICGKGADQENCYSRQLKMNLVIPLKIRTYGLQGEIRDQSINGGSYKVKALLVAIPDVKDQEASEAWQIHEEECREDINLYDTGGAAQKTKFISLSCNLKVSYFNNNAKYKVVVEIDPEEGLPFKKFQGVYTIEIRQGIRQGIVTHPAMDGEIDEKYQDLKTGADVISDMNIQDIHSLLRDFRAEPSASGKEGAPESGSRFNRLGFHPVYLNLSLEKVTFSEVHNNETCADNESAVKRKVKFIGKACMQDALTDQKYKDTEFRVFIGKRQSGEADANLENVEEIFKDEAKKTRYETDANGCIYWTDVIEHNIYDRQIYYVREMSFLSEDLNLYGTAYVALSPWQRAFQAYQDINQLSVDEIRTKPAGIDKPRMIINQFRSVNFFPSYIIDKLLNLHIYHNLYFLFQPFIERHDNLALGRDHRARELIRDGYYIARILLMRNAQETGDMSRVLSPDQAHAARSQLLNERAAIKIIDGEYLTHMDTVIKAKANFLNLYMPLHLTRSQLLYLASRNIISIQVVPADPSGFRFKKIEGDRTVCELDFDKTVWKPYPYSEHELESFPYAGAFNVQNWMNWNVLHPQKNLNTDAIIERSEIGRQYRHFCLSGDCPEAPQSASFVARLGGSSDGCAENLKKNPDYDFTDCAPDVSDLTPDEAKNLEKPIAEIPADRDSAADRILSKNSVGDAPPLSPVRGELAAQIKEVIDSGENLLKGFAEKNALRVVELSGEEGERFIEDLGGFFEALEESKELLTADILPAVPNRKDRKRLRGEISESCGGAWNRFFSDEYETCVHGILLAYMESQVQLLKDLDSEKWAVFFKEAESLAKPLGAGFLETVPDVKERDQLEAEIAKACDFESADCAHNILDSYFREKSQRFEDMEEYLQRERQKAAAGEFFYTLSNLAGISGEMYGTSLEEAPLSPLLLERPLAIWSQTAPYLMEQPRRETLMGIIDEGITSQNSGGREVLSFARSLCGFWFNSYLRDYLEPEQMIAAYTDYVSKFDYYQVLESDWDQNDKSAFLSDFMNIVPEEGRIRQCHGKYARCVLSDHCQLRLFSKKKQYGYCAEAPKEEETCLKIRKEECAAAPHLSFCERKSHRGCAAALNNFCHISPNHKACYRFRSRCLNSYYSCLGSDEAADFFRNAAVEGAFDLEKECLEDHAADEHLVGYRDSYSDLEKCFRLRNPMFKTCERDPFEFFKFENKMFIHELARKNPQYVNGFTETISVTGSFSTGSYMNWTSQRSTNLNTSMNLLKFGLSKSSGNPTGQRAGKINMMSLKLDFFDIGSSISKGISSNESNSGRRAIDVRVNKSAFLTTSRATMDIGAAKFQKCLVVKPRPNAFFAKMNEGLWEAYPKTVWSKNFRDSDFRKIFVSRPGLIICNPPEQRGPEDSETIRESYYYTQALGDPTNSQLLNLYDLANRPFMSLIRGRKEFLKFFNMMKVIIEGDNGDVSQNAALNHPPSNMFINYPHPVEEMIGLSLSLRVFNETGFYPGIFNYADDSDDLDAAFIKKEQGWFLNLFEKLRNINYFPIPAQPTNRIPVQGR